MSDRELRPLGIILLSMTSGTTIAGETIDVGTTDTIIGCKNIVTTASQMIPFRDATDLSSAEGKKFY